MEWNGMQNQVQASRSSHCQPEIIDQRLIWPEQRFPPGGIPPLRKEQWGSYICCPLICRGLRSFHRPTIHFGESQWTVSYDYRPR